MPLGGKLVLKGGETLGGGVHKKKKKKSKKPAAEDAEQQHDGGEGEQQPQDAAANKDEEKKAKKSGAPGITTKGTSYEQEFSLEMERLKQGKVRSTAWGSTYRAAPEVLHGYDRKVTGKTASERLDMRSASKADKFCK